MRFLLSPRWVAAHIVVAVLGVTMVGLGFWQLARLEERRLDNLVTRSRYEAAPEPLSDLLAGAGDDLASLEFRRASVSGTYLSESELLLRSQVRQGTAGFEVLTPLEAEAGSTVLVNRGWVPLEFDTAPVAVAAPPSGPVEVEGVVRLSRERGTFGRDDAGRPDDDVLSRVDLEIASERTGLELVPVYLEVVGESDPTRLPVPAPPPDLADEGSHLSYAIQWFSFAAVAILGYGALIRRAIRRPEGRVGPRRDERGP